MAGDRDTSALWAQRPAPGGLALVQRFANTHAYSGWPDALATSAGAASWLAAQGYEIIVRTASRQRLVRAREAIRGAIAEHHGDGGREGAGDELAAALDVPLGVAGRDGTLAVVAAGRGIDLFLGDLAVGITDASVTGQWERLKLCRNDECAVAHWDHTRNGAARFCSSAVCANRVRQRAYRERLRPV